MSVEEAVTDALQTPIEPNAQSAEDAKKLLAELQGETTADTTTVKSEDTKEAIVKSEDVKETNGDAADPEQGIKPQESPRTERRDYRNDRGDRGDRGGRGGFRGGRGGSYKSKSFRENIKSDLTSQQETDDPVAVRKQVEFYFSDSNLPLDKFLLNKVGGSKNNPVELKIIHSFKRMRHFQPFEAIVKAMKDSTFLELTDDDTCVRRREPLPENFQEEADAAAVKVFEDKAMPRSVYVKGFGHEIPSTQFDIEAFFAPYGPTNAVRLRRTDDKSFKGSVFVEFETEELATAFLAVDPKPTYKGKDLQIISKKEYCDQKVEDIKSGKIKPNNNNRGAFRGGRGGDQGGRDFKRKRDDEDDRDWRDRRDSDRKNGFRDDRRRGDRSSRGGRGGRRREDELDERGIPRIKSSASPEQQRGKRDTDRADAIAKARAVVEAENKKQESTAADDIEASEQAGKTDAGKATADTVAGSIQKDAAEMSTESKKRARDDNDEAGPEAKKVDVKSENLETTS